MKYLSSRAMRGSLILLLLAGFVPPGQSQTSSLRPLNILVTPEGHTASGPALPNTPVRSEIRTEKLNIAVQNTTRQSYTNLILRYCLFDQDVQNQKIAIVQQHERLITVPSFATLMITSQVASLTHTPSHVISLKQKPAKKGEPETIKETPVKATGKVFAGYGVQVIQTNLVDDSQSSLAPATNLVVGQRFSTLDLTNQFKAAFGGTKKKP